MCHMGVHLTLVSWVNLDLNPTFPLVAEVQSHPMTVGECLDICSLMASSASWALIDLDIKRLLYCLPQNLNQSICKRVILLMIGKVGGQKHITYYIALFSGSIFTAQHQKFLSWLFLCSTCSSVLLACLSSSAHLFTPSPPRPCPSR